MATIAEFLQQVNGTKPGECYGKCGKMVTEKDKDHAYCDECWDREIAKMPMVHVTFANDNPEVLMKPSPAEVRTFHSDDPPSDISSTSSEEEEPLCLQTASDMLKRSANPWVPPHKRVKAPGPTPLVRKEAVETYVGPREKYGRGHRLRDGDSSDEDYDLALQCDEEFRSTDEEEFTDYCPGCESGCDADDAHRSGHEGDGYHPDCYMNAEEEDGITYMDPPPAKSIVPTDDELLRRKHSNQAMARILQEAAKIRAAAEAQHRQEVLEIPEGMILHGGRLRKERFFDQFGDEI